VQTRSRFWTVSYRFRGQTQVHTSTTLRHPESVARNYATATGWSWATDVTVSEVVYVKTDRPIRVEDLPGPGQPTPLPSLPGNIAEVRRYFRCQDDRRTVGPPVLPTGDRVRRYLAWVAEGRKRQSTGGPALRNDIRFPDPAALQVRDVQLVIASRTVTVDQLPL
jgi:hypothetical protein